MRTEVKTSGRRRPIWAVALLAFAVLAAALSLSIATIDAFAGGIETKPNFNPRYFAWTDPSSALSPTHMTSHIFVPYDNDWDHQIKTMTISMPPGMAPDPNAAPYCPQSAIHQLYRNANDWRPPSPMPELDCAKIGSVRVGGYKILREGTPYESEFYSTGVGDVVNADPLDGYEGRLLIVIRYLELPESLGSMRPVQPPDNLPIDQNSDVIPLELKLREGDFGIDATVREMPHRVYIWKSREGVPRNVKFRISDVNLILDGTTGIDYLNPSNNHPLLSNPTVCGDHRIDVEFTSYAGEAKSLFDTFPTTGCRRMDFSPELEVSVNPPIPNNTSELTVTLRQSPLGEAHMKSTTVTLPVGINILSTVKPCSRAAAASASCPAESKIGDALANAQALFEPLKGGIYLVEPDANGNLGLLLTLRGLINLNLLSPLKLDVLGGTITTEFSDLPQLPITEFRLTIHGGKGSILKTPKCGNYPIKARFASHSGMLYESASSLNLPCGPSIAEGPKKPSVSVKYLRKGRLRLYVKPGKGSKLKKVSASLGKLIKKRLLRKKSSRKRLLRKLKGKRPKKARFSLSRKGTLTVRSRSSKGTSRILFKVPRSYLKRFKSCKGRKRVKVSVTYTSGASFKATRKMRPKKHKNCGKRRSSRRDKSR